MGYRCVSSSECKNFNVDSLSDTPFIPFQRVCQRGCPSDFQIKYAVDGNKMSASCTPCVGKNCWKSCKAPVIDSIQAAEQLKGCQIIEGPLEIQIRSKVNGSAVFKALNDSLSEIVEIEGFLKVARSTQITTLSFLKKLQVIRGNQLESKKYALVVWDNQKLQKLFRDDQQVEIEKGNLFFHFNPRLCFDEVEKLATGIITIDNYEIAKHHNGDKETCNYTRLEVVVLSSSDDNIKIQWTPAQLESGVSVFSYVVYYVEASEMIDDDFLDEDE